MTDYHRKVLVAPLYELCRYNIEALTAENNKLKHELAQTQRVLDERDAERDALRKEIKWMQEEMRLMLAEVRAARQQSDEEVRELYRERDIAKAKAANRGDADLLH
jgi:hypothetical protein